VAIVSVVVIVVVVATAIVAVLVAIVTSSVVIVIFVLTIVVAIIVADLVVELISMEAPLPPDVTAPGGMFAAHRKGSAIAEVRIIVVVDVAMESDWAMEPGAGTEEDAAGEPLRAVVAEGGALVGRVVEVAVGASGLSSDMDVDADLGR
jgi:hypothetical protein